MLPPAAVGVVTRPLPRLRLVGRPVSRPLVLKDQLGPSTIRAAGRRRVPGGTRQMLFFSVAQNNQQTTTAGTTILNLCRIIGCKRFG